MIALLAAGCTGPATPAPSPAPGAVQTPPASGETMTLYIGPALADCTAVGVDQCLQAKTSPAGEYQLFYDPIQGFDYEPGFDYEITVSRVEVENPPADASNYRYNLVAVISKTPAVVAETDRLPLEGPLWRLESMLGANALSPVLAGSLATARFQGGEMSGNATCNQFFGAYQLSGGNLSVTVGGSTMMACQPPELMQQEITYLSLLGQTASFAIDGEQLMLQDASGNAILRYTAVVSPPLVGTTWTVAAYNNGQGGLTSPLAATEITLLLAADGVVSGAAGCNNYTGGYTIADSAIAIGPLVTTRKMCLEPEGVMEQEFAFANALQQAASFAILGDELTLLDAAGAALVQAGAGDTAAQSAGETPPAEATLIGPTWQWLGSAYTSGGEQTVADSVYTVQFLSDGSLALQADCNSGSGSYRVDGDALAIQLGAMTMVACPPESLADTFLAELGQIASFDIREGMLHLNLATDAGVMRFVQVGVKSEGEAPSGGAEAPLLGDTLVNTAWRWLETSATAEIIAPTFPDRYRISFQPEGRVGLRADCNTGGGVYKSDGIALGLQVSLLTRAVCPQGSKSQTFVDQLNRAASYVIAGENLTITLQDGAGQMKFEPAAQ
jgi:heat shock protein HslJ